MGLPTARFIALVALVVVYLNVGTNYGLVRTLQTGLAIEYGRSIDASLRLIREALIFILGARMAFGLLTHKKYEHGRVLMSAGAVAVGYMFVAGTIRAYLAGSSASALFVGLRAAPLLLILATLPHYPHASRDELLDRLARGARWFPLIEASWVFYQITSTPGTFGATFLGPRAYGTFSSPNNLGMATLAIMVLMVMRRPRGWRATIGVCLFLVTCAGSRTGLLGAVIVLVTGPLSRSRHRLFLLYPLLLAVAALGFIFTNQAFSGREIHHEGRFAQWAQLMENIQNPLNWIIGSGLSFGSNAAHTLDFGAKTVVSDSTLVATLLSFGVLGVLGLLVGLFKLMRRAELDARWRCLPVLMLAGMSFNVPEISPLNIVGVLVMGCAMPYCWPKDQSAVGTDLSRERPVPVGATR